MGEKRLYRVVLIISLLLLPSIYLYADNNNLKATVLSYITGSAKITWERAMWPKQSMELTAGAIGVGGDAKKNDPSGYTVRGAYKWILSQFYKEDNPLDGLYLKPEVAYSNFSYLNGLSEVVPYVRESIERTALMACVGYQIVRNIFVFDFFVGGGYSWGDLTPYNYYHGFINLNADSNLALTFGLKLGVAF